MPSLTYILICLAAAGLVAWIGSRPRLQKVSEDLNKAALASVETMTDQKPEPRIGGPGQLLEFRGRRTFRLVFKLRALATVMIAIILLVFRADVATAGPETILPPYANIAFHAACGVALYYLAFTWCYRLTLKDSVLWVPTAACGRRSYDLNHLEFFEETGPYTVSLYFKDGSYADIMRAVQDRKYFLTVLGIYGDRVTKA